MQEGGCNQLFASICVQQRDHVMPIKSALLFFVAVFIGLATSPAYAGDIISCDSFETCPALPTDEILALEARIEALETLLAGTTRRIDPNTSQDTLTFDNSTSSEAVVVRELSTTEKEGNLPVCFNGAGELLPCASNVEPPPQASLVGLWSGRMIYDRDYAGSGTCYDADVLINLDLKNAGSPGEYLWIDDITVDRDGGSTSSAGGGGGLTNNYVTGSFVVFGMEIEFSIRFDDYGQAEGSWRETYNGNDCYGTWAFTKD